MCVLKPQPISPQGGLFSALRAGQHSARPPAQQTEGWSQGAAGLLLWPAASPLQGPVTPHFSVHMQTAQGNQELGVHSCLGSGSSLSEPGANRDLALPLRPWAAQVGTPGLAQGVGGFRGPQVPVLKGRGRLIPTQVGQGAALGLPRQVPGPGQVPRCRVCRPWVEQTAPSS